MSRLWHVLYVVAKPALMVAIHGTVRSRVLIRSEGRMLVIKNRLGDGSWVLPGGGLHKGEPHEQGAIREVAEETGLVIAPEQLKSIGTEQMKFGWARFTCQYFVADIAQTAVTRKQWFEVSQISWLPPQDLNASNAGPEVLRALALSGHE